MKSALEKGGDLPGFLQEETETAPESGIKGKGNFDWEV